MSAGKAIWSWISDVKSKGLEASYESLRGDLEAQPLEQRTAIATAYQSLVDALNTLLLWEAGSLLNGAPLGDDSFEYFRNWLIWSGEHVFATAATTPDSLLECDVDLSSPFFENLGVCAEFLPRQAKSNPLSSGQFRPGAWDWRDSSAEKIAADLPRLWAVYGKSFCWAAENEASSAVSFEAPGLGLLKIGDRVLHKFGYGEGIIVDVLVPETALAQIQFEAESKPFRLTSQHFDLVR